MLAKVMRAATRGLAVSMCLAAGVLLAAEQHAFDGTWQMDAAKSHVSDGRVVTMTIASVEDGVNVTMKTKKSDGQETTSEWNGKLNGKIAEVTEGAHKSQLTMWYNGATLNACKEKGPAGDVTSMWKFELTPDKQGMTVTLSHYEPAAGDETLAFKKGS